MGFYSKYVLPTLTDLAMRSHMLRPERARWVPLAKGTVLEMGVPFGLNLPMYGREVRKPTRLTPRRSCSGGPVRARRARPSRWSSCAGLPRLSARGGVGGQRRHNLDALHDPGSFGGSPGDASRAATRGLAHLRREHGRSPDLAVVQWPDRLTPLWRRVAGGCHLNRPIDGLLRLGRLENLEMKRGRRLGPRWAGGRPNPPLAGESRDTNTWTAEDSIWCVITRSDEGRWAVGGFSDPLGSLTGDAPDRCARGGGRGERSCRRQDGGTADRPGSCVRRFTHPRALLRLPSWR